MLKELLSSVETKKIINVEEIKTLQNLIEKFGYHIKDKCFYEFPNKAKTLVWILMESHFIIHEYPEYNLILINLFTCRNETNAKLYDFMFEIAKVLNGKIINYTIIAR